MAIPRIFISSTCYDLKEIRLNLKSFIENFGFDPVMSEFGDIFYDYNMHVQDSCLEEIKKCQLFVLVIGNKYGSIYHEHNEPNQIPDSITFKEFKRALEIDINKHIFIDKFVSHDYLNYAKALKNAIANYFKNHEIPDSKIDEVRYKVKKEFDSKFIFFPDSYRYLFNFIEIIYELNKNNAITPFESFDDIKDSLRKQWAGFMYDSITKKSKVTIDEISSLFKKVDNIENKLNQLLDIRTVTEGKKITFDISNLVKEIDLKNLEEVQNKVSNLLFDILNCDWSPRINFSDKFSNNKVLQWISNFENIIKSYKWSKYIDINILFENTVNYRWWNDRNNIPCKTIIELNVLYNSFNNDDQESLRNTIMCELNKNYVEPEYPEDPESTTENENLPF